MERGLSRFVARYVIADDCQPAVPQPGNSGTVVVTVFSSFFGQKPFFGPGASAVRAFAKRDARIRPIPMVYAFRTDTDQLSAVRLHHVRPGLVDCRVAADDVFLNGQNESLLIYR